MKLLLRIKPSAAKLAALTEEETDSILDSYGDMQSHWSRREVGMLTLIGIVNGYNGFTLTIRYRSTSSSR